MRKELCILTMQTLPSQDIYRNTEINIQRNELSGDLNVLDPTGGRWNRRAVFAHALEMEFDRFPNGDLRLCRCAASRHATGQIRNVRRKVIAGGFNDDCIAHDIYLISSSPTASGYS